MKTFKSVLLLLFFAVICESGLFAENAYNFSQLGSESVDFIKQPGKWGWSDLLKLGVVVGGTAAIHQYDQSIRDFVLKHPKNADSLPVKIGEQWGGYYVLPLSIVGFYIHGCLADNNTTKKMGFEIAQGAIYAETISVIMKFGIGRARPYTNEGPSHFKSFSFFDSNNNSFPAGHVDAAFVLSTVLSRNIDSKFWKVLVYVPAGLTAVSRVYRDYHWASDCLFGAAIGYYVGTWVVDLHEKKESKIHLSSTYPPTIQYDF
ncbi:MAG: phosphatase PAP2 family protein [Elusimicrobia bacterium]|nr:phosphatase PAP2 family protein [Elusimicrobiota bacterium]